jgi:hypothetical protein
MAMIEEERDYDLEILGLHSGTNNRSCCQHEKCGEHVVVGDILRLVQCIVTIHGNAEEAIKLVKIDDGSETCTVAFVPRDYAHLPRVKERINKIVQVVEIYKDSDNTHKRRMDQVNRGMASASFLDDIPLGA